MDKKISSRENEKVEESYATCDLPDEEALDQVIWQTCCQVKSLVADLTLEQRKKMREERLLNEGVVEASIPEIVDASIAGIYNCFYVKLSENGCFMDSNLLCYSFVVAHPAVLSLVIEKTGLKVKPYSSQEARVTLIDSAKIASVKVMRGKNTNLDFGELFREVSARQARWEMHRERLANCILDKLVYQTEHFREYSLIFPEEFEFSLTEEEIAEVFTSDPEPVTSQADSSDESTKPAKKVSKKRKKKDKFLSQDSRYILSDVEQRELLKKLDSLTYSAGFDFNYDETKQVLKITVRVKTELASGKLACDARLNLQDFMMDHQVMTPEFERLCRLISDNLSCEPVPRFWPELSMDRLPVCGYPPFSDRCPECLLIYRWPKGNKYLDNTISWFFGRFIKRYLMWLKFYLEEHHPAIDIMSAYCSSPVSIYKGVVFTATTSWVKEDYVGKGLLWQRLMHDEEVPRNLPAKYQDALILACRVIKRTPGPLAKKVLKVSRELKPLDEGKCAKIWLMQLLRKIERLIPNTRWTHELAIYSESEAGFRLSTEKLDYLIMVDGEAVDLSRDPEFLKLVISSVNSLTFSCDLVPDGDGFTFLMHL